TEDGQYAEKEKEGVQKLQKAASNMRQILKNNYISQIKKIAAFLSHKEHVYVIGRGVSYATTLESTLKIKEASYIHAEGFAGGELKHGVIALIEKGTPCIVYAPNDETYDDIISNAQEIKARGGTIIGIGPTENRVFDYFLKTGDFGDATILVQTTVAHLLGYYLAIAKNVPDPDKPRNLAKSVTVK
ncbi:SIS domain-containing protein, partial [Candidatus Roizmanbacteria bacterium]|nr:SIS domain-containing protein [Candidatus Roizmanbacteria bacterium]